MSFNESVPFSFDIRPATFSDIGDMALVLDRATSQREGLPLPTELTHAPVLGEVIERMGKLGAWAQVAIGRVQMAGFILGHPSSEEETIQTDSTVEYISLLMTEPNYWRRGVGSALLDTAVGTARDRGREHLVLWTAASNLRAQRVYENYGFHVTRNTRISQYRGAQLQYRLDI